MSPNYAINSLFYRPNKEKKYLHATGLTLKLYCYLFRGRMAGKEIIKLFCGYSNCQTRKTVRGFEIYFMDLWDHQQ